MTTQKVKPMKANCLSHLGKCKNTWILNMTHKPIMYKEFFVDIFFFVKAYWNVFPKSKPRFTKRNKTRYHNNIVCTNSKVFISKPKKMKLLMNMCWVSSLKVPLMWSSFFILLNLVNIFLLQMLSNIWKKEEGHDDFFILDDNYQSSICMIYRFQGKWFWKNQNYKLNHLSLIAHGFAFGCY